MTTTAPSEASGESPSDACLRQAGKNWLFFGSDTGGRTAAILASFITTCKRLHIDPFAYLRDIFQRISAHLAKRLDELLPDHWKAAQSATPNLAS